MPKCSNESKPDFFKCDYIAVHNSIISPTTMISKVIYCIKSSYTSTIVFSQSLLRLVKKDTSLSLLCM